MQPRGRDQFQIQRSEQLQGMGRWPARYRHPHQAPHLIQQLPPARPVAVLCPLLSPTFKVDCKSKITVVQNNQPFSIDKSPRTIRTAAGTTAEGMLAHPLKLSSTSRARRRSIYSEGLVPRCVKNLEQLVCRDKKDATPPTANGWSSKGSDWIPDFTVGAACEKHSLCYASCDNGQSN